MEYRLWPALFACVLAQAQASAADFAKEAELYAPSIWDLKIGAHARQLPTEQFIDFACGTNGGPPSMRLGDWSEFAKCPVEAASGLHEVYFRYDDEPEYAARAVGNETQLKVYEYTSIYAMPVIASALFDRDGFLIQVRAVTDPRVPVVVRENAVSLRGFLLARYGEDGWACEDLERLDGETEYRGSFVKRRCRKYDAASELNLLVEARLYRRAGQVTIDPVTRLTTEGQFESSTRFEMILPAPIADVAQRLAALPPKAPSEKDALIARARNCAGCDLHGADLKRANLAGANLAGANLSGANLHGATLANAILVGANLTKANINRADLRRAQLANAVMREAMIFESRLDGADLSAADLTGAMAGKVQLIGARLVGATMIGVDLRAARLNDADFSDADLTYSWLHDARIERGTFARAKLTETILWRVNLAGADLEDAQFQSADLFGVNLRGANLSGTDFTNARLTSANLTDARIDGAKWDGADLPIGFQLDATVKP